MLFFTQVSNVHAVEIPFVKTAELKLTFSNESEESKNIAKQLDALLKRYRSATSKELGLNRPYSYAKNEMAFIKKFLHSEAYFAATMELKLTESNNLLDKQIYRYEYLIDLGPRYRIDSIELNLPETLGTLKRKDFSLKKNSFLRANDILRNQESLLNFARTNGCFWNPSIQYRVRLSHKTHKANISYSLKDEREAFVNVVKFTGLETIKEDYLYSILTIEQGECFKRKRVENNKVSLLRTNLIASADIKLEFAESHSPTSADHENKQPVNITFAVTERLHRGVNAGINYGTNTKFGYSLGWQHRNLFGKAEQLDIQYKKNDLISQLTGTYTLPNFLSPRQELTLELDLAKESYLSYEATSTEMSGIIARQHTNNLSSTFGLSLRRSREEAREGVDDPRDESISIGPQTYNLFSIPLSAILDYRNDLLNPTRGWSLQGSFRPFVDLTDSSIRFDRWTSTATTFLNGDWIKNGTVLALKASMGALTGADLEDLPVEQRFFVGGGGSVRGYAYQTLGPLTSEGRPTGGLSYGEASAELRFKHGENWGSVLFIDGGFAYESDLPNFGSDFQKGVGLGIRYYTSFAPIRFDIGFPLDKCPDKEKVDVQGGSKSKCSGDYYEQDDFQLYISLGQAF